MFTIHQECKKLKKAVEEQTAKLTPGTCLWSAAACLGLSMGLKCINRKRLACMIGQWTAPFLLFGLYIKMAKIMDSSSQPYASLKPGMPV